MKDTGERHILNKDFKNKPELYLHLVHVATYEYAKQFTAGKKVLDFGCGSGYGAKMLSETAEYVFGVDISQEAVDFAKKEYISPNLDFITYSGLGNEKFDVITSFQVIEHVKNDSEYITQLKKLLAPKGILLISTPDRKNRLFNYIQKPWNIFHLKEYSYKSLKQLLENHFSTVEILKIGSDCDLVFEEIARTKRQRNITLPATLFFYPDFVRITLLKMQRFLFESLKSIKSGSMKSESIDLSNNTFISDYTYEDILFEKELKYSTDLLVITKNDL
ncbi:class I SAM-dependent methyltransferase [Chryseobacterium sp. JJR-5R]|uniref:class I SAM-dependent methyltransferase n=1 Tax=Chryseobacterium sp. JJR-5R TaxID=3093923 RepID=UPI002A752007|nr:class I SAM-dependent methyltransferase [Chryseobacterium sp. JJR-5R]WPO83987.1 class I SAM-dependent methyltransferase [Chryseobacterium sp. JJR-5R]